MKIFKWKNLEISQTSRTWCLNTLSSIVGTVVGIILTFGVTFWVAYRDKQSENKKATMIVLENIATINEECLNTAIGVGTSVSILEKMFMLSPEEVNQMSDETISDFINKGFVRSLLIYEDIGRNLINSNFDILKSTENYQFLIEVSFFYSIYNEIEKLYEKAGPSKLTEQINEVLFDNAIKEGFLDFNSERWTLLEIAKSTEVKIYIRNYLDNFIPKIKELTKILYKAAVRVAESSGFTEEEFDEFFKNAYKNERQLVKND